MEQKNFCINCAQEHQCQKVYRQLGNSKSPSLACKVFVAFALPIMAFIIALAVFERILEKSTIKADFQTILSAALAFMAVIICVLAIKKITKKLGKNK